MLTGNEKLAEVVKKNADSIASKVLANEILYNEDVPGAKEMNINGETVNIGVKKL